MSNCFILVFSVKLFVQIVFKLLLKLSLLFRRYLAPVVRRVELSEPDFAFSYCLIVCKEHSVFWNKLLDSFFSCYELHVNFPYASVQPLSVAIFLSASVSLAKFVEPSVSVCLDVTVWRPLMNTMSES